MDVLFRLAETLETFHLTTWAAAHVYQTQYAMNELISLPADVVVKIAAPILQKLRRGVGARVIVTGFSDATVAELKQILEFGPKKRGGVVQLESYAVTKEIPVIPPRSEIIYITGLQDNESEAGEKLLQDYAAKLDDRTFASVTRVILETAPLERVKNIWKPQSGGTLQKWFENSFNTVKTRFSVPPVIVAYSTRS